MDESQRQFLFDTPSNIVFPRKLETALRASTVTNFMSRVANDQLTSDDYLITKSKTAMSGLPTKMSTLGYTDILSKIMKDSNDRMSYDVREDLKRSETTDRAIDLALTMQIEILFEHNDLPLKQEVMKNIGSFLKNNKDSLLLRNILHTLRRLDKLVSDSHKVSSPRLRRLSDRDRLTEQLKLNSYEDPNDLFKCSWSQKLMILRTDGDMYVYPKAYLLLIHNKLADLASVLMLAQANSGAAMPRMSAPKVLEFLKIMIDLHYKFDSQFYAIAKSLEALCIAESLIDLDDWVNDEFLDALSTDLKKDPGFVYKTSKLRNFIKQLDVPFRHEICCLSKLFGHPLVDMEGGALSLHKTTNEVHTINPMKVVECTNFIKENYIRNYIIKHGIWPPAHIENINCCTALKEAWVQNVDPNSAHIRRKYGPVAIEEYVHVEVLPSMKFEPLNNAIRYLKDKTISVLRYKVMAYYINQDSREKAPRWTETRLLLFYMLHDKASLDHTEFIRRYAASEDLEELIDYLVIRIVPKEKELKEIFRGFGCLTYQNRLRCLAQEKNVMHFLDLYCDEQAMTLSELELLKKLYALRTITKAYPRHKPIYISIDASKWNNHFRAATVDEAMKPTLDKIFGMPVFGKTHKAYEKTLFYVPDEQENYYWEGQSGGIEGLNQDTWVVTYLAQIKSAMRTFDFHYQAFCKGDDFRVVVLVPPHVYESTPLATLKTSIVEKVSNVASEYGHKVKILESYGSVCYFSFSKVASYKTIELPQGFRKIQKCYGANNAFIPTLDEYIGSAFSNAHSTCKTVPHVLGCYMVALKWACYSIQNSTTYRGLSYRHLAALLLTPSMVGGFPIIYLHNMFVRAESDLLTPFINMLRYTQIADPILHGIMIRFLRIPTKTPSSVVSLCKDPYSLPCDRPDLPTTILRKILLQHLKPIIKNEDLVALFKAYDSSYTTQIMKCLESSNVYDPKIMSHIYAATPAGQVEELVRKFESSRSVHEILILRSGRRRADRALRVVIRAEIRLQKWRRERLDGKNYNGTKSMANFLVSCPALSADILRKEAWGKKVEGVTSSPLAHSIRFTNALYTKRPMWDRNNAFLLTKVTPTEYIPGSEGNENWSTSDKEPFIGKMTSSGVMHPTVHIVEKDSLLVKLKSIIELISWTNTKSVNEEGEVIQSNMPTLLNNILHTFTGYNIGDLQQFGGVHTYGTKTHHLSAPKFRSSIVPNTLSNIYQQFEGDSAYHARINATPGHYYINYLYVLCHGVCMMTFDLNFSPESSTPSTIWMVTEPCDYCIIPIEETPIVMDLSYLENITPPKLLTTKVVVNALEVLEHALLEYRQQEFRGVLINDNITIEDASIAIMQELSDMALRDKRKLEVRYTGHNLTAEGQRVLETLQPRSMNTGLDEHHYQYLKAEHIITGLSVVVFDFCHRSFPGLVRSRVSERLAMIPVEQLPWYAVVTRLHRINRLRDVLIHLERLRNRSAGIGYVNDSHATMFIGEACYYLADSWVISPPCIFLTYYQAEKFSGHLRKSLYIGFHTWMTSLYGEQLKEFNSIIERGMELIPDVQHGLREIMLVIQILFIADVSSDENISAIVDQLNTRGECGVGLLPIGDVDYEVIMSIEGWEERTGFDKFSKRYGALSWPRVDTMTEEHFDRLYVEAAARARLFSIRIVSTTLVSCVELMRTDENTLMDPRDEWQDENYVAPEALGLTDMRELVPSPTVMRIPPCRHLENLALPVMEVKNFNDNKLILDKSLTMRPFGDATLALSKYSEIWSILQLPVNHPTPLSAIVFGDGLGGTSAFVCAAAHGSYIKIVTLAEKITQACTPALTLRMAERYGCHIDDSSITRGMSDVSDIQCMKDMESDARVYDIVISDIEHNIPESVPSLQLMTNVVFFYLRRRSFASLLIMQMRLDEPNTIYACARILSLYCTTVALIKLRSSSRHEQMYVCAWGTRGYFDHEYGTKIPGDSARVYDAIVNYINRQHKVYRASLDYTSYHLELSTPDWRRFRPWMGVLPWRVGEMLLKRFHILLDLGDYIEDLRYREALQGSLMDWIPPEFMAQQSELEGFFRDFRHHDLNIPSLDLSTRAHNMKMYSSLLRIRGFIACFELCNRTPRRQLDDMDIRRMYAAEIDRAHPRLRIPPLCGAHFR